MKGCGIMLFLSRQMIKDAEMRAMEDVSAMHLIRNASLALFDAVKDFNSVRVYCGKGNNGSDGYATALLLKKSGKDVEIVKVMPPQSEDCKALYEEALAAEIPILSCENYPSKSFDCVIDAIFGIGINGEITDENAIKAINMINSSDSYIVSCDIPSGMDCDTANECGVCVNADKTVTFTAPKKGMLSNSSVDLCGEIVISDVGIAVDYTAISQSTCVPITGKLVKSMLPKRKRYSHKGTFGTSVIVAGSALMPGACAMAAMAAQRSGVGIVKIIAPVSICRILNILVKEAIVIPAPEKNGVLHPELCPLALDAISTADSILVGCGLSVGEHHLLLNNILNSSKCGVIIDADALTSLSGKLDIIRNKDVLITPHPKEFSRISGYSTKEIEKSRIRLADNFAKENGIPILLKGARTVIAYGGTNKYVSLSSTSALAKAGSGDVLAGIIVSLAAQGLSLTDSGAAACYIHSAAGTLAEKELTAYGVTADDLINYIPYAFSQIN